MLVWRSTRRLSRWRENSAPQVPRNATTAVATTAPVGASTSNARWQGRWPHPARTGGRLRRWRPSSPCRGWCRVPAGASWPSRCCRPRPSWASCAVMTDCCLTRVARVRAKGSQPRHRAVKAPLAQAVPRSRQPAGMPDDHGLGRDAELVGDLGLACTGSEEVPSAQSAGPRWSRSRCAAGPRGNSCHTRILAWPAAERQLHPRLHPNTQGPVEPASDRSGMERLPAGPSRRAPVPATTAARRPGTHEDHDLGLED
jgi:hypothetical protein